MTADDSAASSSLLLETIGRLRIDETELPNLRIALIKAEQIGVAVGLIMTARNLPEHQAYNVLSATAAKRKQSLLQLAREVAASGDTSVLPPS